MAHYFLNVVNGIGFTEDEEGDDFPDLAAARAKAVEGIRSILSDDLRTTGEINLRGRIDIVDRHGAIMLTVPFDEAVDLITGDLPPTPEVP
jgi:hypothetical protein